MPSEGYASFSELLAANMRHAGALRIDHAMGLQRLFLVPDGASARDGAYLSYPFRDLLGVLALESQHARCAVVGEALGTVPEGMTAALAEADVLSYSVLWFERDGHGLRRPSDWPAQTAACVSTHDLPTLAGWWQAADIDERVSLGLLDPAGAERERVERRADKVALLTLLTEAGLLHDPVDPAGPVTATFVAAVHGFIAMTGGRPGGRGLGGQPARHGPRAPELAPAIGGGRNCAVPQRSGASGAGGDEGGGTGLNVAAGRRSAVRPAVIGGRWLLRLKPAIRTPISSVAAPGAPAATEGRVQHGTAVDRRFLSGRKARRAG
jgi:hypothetical protein